MAENSFIFSFKKLPKAFLICLMLILASNAIIVYLVDNDIFEISPYRREYRSQLRQAQNKRGDVVIIGNSSGLYIDCDILKTGIFGSNRADILNFSVGGAMPRTFSYIFDDVDYQCVKDNGVVILCLRPMDFNRYNICFQRTMISYFSWKEFFCELVAEKRIDDVRYFLEKRSLYLINYRFEIKSALKQYIAEIVLKRCFLKKHNSKTRVIKPEYDQVQENRRKAAMLLYKNSFVRQYTMDEYQLRHMNMLIKQLKQRNIKVIMVLMPMSKSFMRIVGRKNLGLFCNRMRKVSSEESVALLDFLSSSTGAEFQYFDGMHFVRASESEFSQRLSAEIRKILNN